VLYEMATGERPFHGSTPASLIASIMTAAPEPPTRKQPLAPARLDWVVKRCLEKDPERRWQSASDVGIELEALAAEAEAGHAVEREIGTLRPEIVDAASAAEGSNPTSSHAGPPSPRRSMIVGCRSRTSAPPSTPISPPG
jgi:eukaryotic-like serine/threonine-protein kinase